MAVDEARLTDFLRRFVGDLGATLAAANVVLGDRLGLYKALAVEPQRPEELAARTFTTPRYVEEWLRGQAAGGYVEYDAETGRYWMTDEQASALTDPDGPVFVPRAFELALTALHAQDRIAEAFRTGVGLGRPEPHHDVFGYLGDLMTGWLPALDGVIDKLELGARVADVGCGHGASTVLMAKAFPASAFTGLDQHDECIDWARKRSADAGLNGRVTFEVAAAQDFEGTGYDLVTTFDCLHDLGDAVGAGRQIRQALDSDGTWMIIEPYAGDKVEDNLNPVGRLYYSLSSFMCVPNALSEHGGYSLGAQAGEEAICRLAHDAGFSRFRRVAETPFNIVYEARP